MNVNIWFYLFWNWLELFVLVIVSYRIRNVRDELNISKELFTIIINWIFFSSLYLGFTFYNVKILKIDNNDKIVTDIPIPAQICNMIFIQSRNLGTVIISTLFCLKAIRSEDLLVKTKYNLND